VSVIEQNVAGVDVAVPPKTPSPANSASLGWATKLPVSENAVSQDLDRQLGDYKFKLYLFVD
jgi:hypothetical protein